MQLPLRFLLPSALAFACSGQAPQPTSGGLGVVVPTTLGEGSNPDASPATAPASNEPRRVANETPPPPDAQPDPEPLRVRDQWEYEVAWDAGELKVLATEPRRFPQPVVTARKMGRFAIELWIGQELVERVRFDFPLLAADERDVGASRPGPPSLEKGAHVRQRVLVPDAPRARRAVLVDRATGKSIALAWPPLAQNAARTTE